MDLAFDDLVSDDANDKSVSQTLLRSLQLASANNELGEALALARRANKDTFHILRRLGLSQDGMSALSPIPDPVVAALAGVPLTREHAEYAVATGVLPSAIASCSSPEDAGVFLGSLLQSVCNDLATLEVSAVDALGQPLRDALAPLSTTALVAVIRNCRPLHQCGVVGPLLVSCITRGRSEGIQF
jgi:hypothetical protein